MELVKLQSKKDGKIFEGFVFRDENKDWKFRKYEEPYGWQDSFLTYYKPISEISTMSNDDKVEAIM